MYVRGYLHGRVVTIVALTYNDIVSLFPFLIKMKNKQRPHDQ
jgi:hypothetical protein